MKPKRVNVKERVSENGEIDLSMSDLQDVPVKDIAVFKKVYSLDLSNNHLKTLPPNFATLTHITKLDLSKNQLKELPENFGDLIKLKHLDLYQNNLEFLPLSFSKLRSLKWLDLKDNPLTPTVAKVAGQCLDAKQCQTCAKDVVNFFVQIQEQVASDIESRTKNRQRQLEINQQKQKEQNKKAKKKEKNKQNNKQQNGPASAGNKENSAGKSQNQTKKDKKNADAGKLKQQPKKSSLSILKLLVFFVFFTVLALFILASLAEFQQKIKIVFDEGVKLLPPHLQTHAVTAGAYVRDFHGQTVNVTVNFVNTVRNNEQVVLAANTVRRLSEHLQNRVKELFGS